MAAPAIFAAMLDRANRDERLDGRRAHQEHLNAFVQDWLSKNHPRFGGRAFE